jgi:uncharacterized integral membrane protein
LPIIEIRHDLKEHSVHSVVSRTRLLPRQEPKTIYGLKVMISFDIPEEKKDYTTLIAKILLLVLCILMIVEIADGVPLL